MRVLQGYAGGHLPLGHVRTPPQEPHQERADHEAVDELDEEEGLPISARSNALPRALWSCQPGVVHAQERADDPHLVWKREAQITYQRHRLAVRDQDGDPGDPPTKLARPLVQRACAPMVADDEAAEQAEQGRRGHELAEPWRRGHREEGRDRDATVLLAHCARMAMIPADGGGREEGRARARWDARARDDVAAVAAEVEVVQAAFPKDGSFVFEAVALQAERA